MKRAICTIACFAGVVCGEALFDINLTVAQRILLVISLAVMLGWSWERRTKDEGND